MHVQSRQDPTCWFFHHPIHNKSGESLILLTYSNDIENYHSVESEKVSKSAEGQFGGKGRFTGQRVGKEKLVRRVKRPHAMPRTRKGDKWEKNSSPFKKGVDMVYRQKKKSNQNGQANAVKLKGHSVARARAFEHLNPPKYVYTSIFL